MNTSLINRPVLALIVVVVAGTATGILASLSYDPLWIAVGSTTAMGHSATTTTVVITRTTSNYTSWGKVTDMDTFQRVAEPHDYQLQAGNENDVVIERNFNPTTISYAFNAVTGERAQDYTFNGPFKELADSGDIDYLYHSIRGVDYFESGARHDETTNWSTQIVERHYVPHAEPGG